WLKVLILTDIKRSNDKTLKQLKIKTVSWGLKILITKPETIAPITVFIEFTKPLILNALSKSLPSYNVGTILDPIGV
ncbi:hypothetical protein, partial [Salinivibrio costicola]|uniref:hypothetical protein n=1 Tax=Salinivibrio costicola TaxID=51367 RepID=UPI0013E333F9